MKHQDIHIEKKDPFANCKLDRGKYAHILSTVVNSDATGFVLAINGKWGTGKTTFVKMWKQLLENNGHKTIYFNAWENDFVSEPMVGILGELKTLANSESEQLFNSILDKASKFSIKIIPALLKGIAKHHLGEEASEIIEKGAEATTDIFEDEIKSYDEKKESLQALKEDLKKFVCEKCKKKPVIFIVDELDTIVR